MYDARGNSSGRSGLLFGALTVAVVAVAFFGILLMPHGQSKSAVPGIAQNAPEGHAVLAVLTDRPTRKYVEALVRVLPDSAKRLDAEVEDAIADGADEAELALLLMKFPQDDIYAQVHHLAKADVRHFDQLLRLTKSGLGKMSSTRSKWCKGATYESFATMGPERIERMIEREFGYGTPAYGFAAELNTVLLEAIADAKVNPVHYGAMTAKDKTAMQGAMMQLIANPQIMQLMSLQGQDKATMTRAISNMDFCSLGVTGISAVERLPKDTRGRMWGEVFSKVDERAIQRAMSGMPAF